jgi:hypothetical protein
MIYRVSTKSFTDYRHLLEENYMEYKYIFYYHYLMKLEFSRKDFRKILKYQISLKSVQWEEPTCSTRTDRDVSNSRFSQFCKLAKNMSVYINEIK